MTEQMKQFLTELADLIDKHDVELEATECQGSYYTNVDGIECYMEAHYKDVKRDNCTIKLPVFTDANDIRTIIEKEEKGIND